MPKQPQLRAVRTAAIASIVVLSSGLAACSDDFERDAVSADADVEAAIDGTTHLSVEVQGQTLVEGSRIVMTFEDGRVAVDSGCNIQAGEYSIADGALVVEGMIQTLMACEGGLQEQDQWVAELVTSSPAIRLEDSLLVIEGDGVTVSLANRVDLVDAESIEGLTWTITSVETATGPMSAPGDAHLTVADGQINVATGCNTAFGEVTVEGTTVTLGVLASTRIACESPLAEWENALLGVLQGTLDASVEGDQLVLSGDNGTITLVPVL